MQLVWQVSLPNWIQMLDRVGVCRSGITELSVIFQPLWLFHMHFGLEAGVEVSPHPKKKKLSPNYFFSKHPLKFEDILDFFFTFGIPVNLFIT